MKSVLFISNRIEDTNTGASIVSRLNLGYLKEIFDDRSVAVFSCSKTKNKLNKILKVLITFRVDGMSISAEESIIEKIKAEKIRLVFLDGSMYGFLAKKIKETCRDTIVVIAYHDICYDWIRSLTEIGKYKYLPLILPVSINEKMSAEYADANIFLNKKDEKRQGELYANSTASLVLPVAIEENSKKLSGKKNGRYVLFVGANYEPNIVGIKWYINNVYPYSSMPLHVVGKNLNEYSNYFRINNVICKSNASYEELQDAYQNATYIISPIFSGGGMKVKIAEALAYGKVIVGTKDSFEGYHMTSDMHMADNTGAFILKTLSLNELKEQEEIVFSKINRKNFEDHHSIENNKKSVRFFLENIMCKI